jgi:hypothetical protein
MKKVAAMFLLTWDFPIRGKSLLRHKLTVQIHKLLKECCVTQGEDAKLLGTTQAQVSALMRCRPVSVSVSISQYSDRI